MNIWHLFLYQPLVNALILFYKLFGENLGLAIISLTVTVRLLLIPLIRPSLETGQKMKKLMPQLEKIKKKYSSDKQSFAKAQLDLYRKHGINPAAGCLPQIIQILILIALFQVFTQVLKTDGKTTENLNTVLYQGIKLDSSKNINLKFLYLDLSQPDVFFLPFSFDFLGIKITKFPGIFLLLSCIFQFLSSWLMMPQVAQGQKEAKKTPLLEDDLSFLLQKQMLFMVPLMTLLVGFSFPSGVVLYWATISFLMVGQQLFFLKFNKAKND